MRRRAGSWAAITTGAPGHLKCGCRLINRGDETLLETVIIGRRFGKRRRAVEGSGHPPPQRVPVERRPPSLIAASTIEKVA